jgi:hypothetical protein
VGLIYRQMGRKGLETIENVGPRLAEVIENLLGELLDNQSDSLTRGNSMRLPQIPFGGA